MKQYSVIAADPPWTYRDKAVAGDRGLANKYATMTVEEIAALPVGEIADKDCALFLWATPPCIAEALDVMKAWGFRYSTFPFVWVKTAPAPVVEAVRRFFRGLTLSRAYPTTFKTIVEGLQEEGLLNPGLAWGMGKSTRANVEVVLLGLRGKLNRVSGGVHQVVQAPPGKHSAKPAEVYTRIEQLLGPRERLEMFARERRPGWDAWGNEVPGGNDVELESAFARDGRRTREAT